MALVKAIEEASYEGYPRSRSSLEFKEEFPLSSAGHGFVHDLPCRVWSV